MFLYMLMFIPGIIRQYCRGYLNLFLIRLLYFVRLFVSVRKTLLLILGIIMQI